MIKTIREKNKGPLIQVYADRCAGCLICALRCSLRFEKAFNPIKAKISVLRCVDSDTEYVISFAADCDNCGICARCCPYDALVQERQKETV